MKPRAKSINRLLRSARRELGMTQSELAKQISCKQSAISMFESGRLDVLSSEKISQVAQLFGMDILPADLAQSKALNVPSSLRFCPQPECPSNIPYVVGDELCFKPKMHRVPVDLCRCHCRLCGEVLEAECPHCEASLAEGSFCMSCGGSFVPSEAIEVVDAEQWVEARLDRIQELIDLSESEAPDVPDFSEEKRRKPKQGEHHDRKRTRTA